MSMGEGHGLAFRFLGAGLGGCGNSGVGREEGLAESVVVPRIEIHPPHDQVVESICGALNGKRSLVWITWRRYAYACGVSELAATKP